MRGGPRQVQHLPRQGSGYRAGRKGGAGRASARGPCPPPPGPLHRAPLSSALRSPSPASSAPQPGSLELKIRGGGGGPGGGILRRNRVRMLGWTGNTHVGILRDSRWEPHPPPTHPSLGLGFLLCGRLCNELGPSHSFSYLASVCLSFFKCIKGESIPSPQRSVTFE